MSADEELEDKDLSSSSVPCMYLQGSLIPISGEGGKRGSY